MFNLLFSIFMALPIPTINQNGPNPFYLLILSVLLIGSAALSFSVLNIQGIGSGIGLYRSELPVTQFETLFDSFRISVGNITWPSLNISTLSASVSGPNSILISLIDFFYFYFYSTYHT